MHRRVEGCFVNLNGGDIRNMTNFDLSVYDDGSYTAFSCNFTYVN